VQNEIWSGEQCEDEAVDAMRKEGFVRLVRGLRIPPPKYSSRLFAVCHPSINIGSMPLDLTKSRRAFLPISQGEKCLPYLLAAWLNLTSSITTAEQWKTSSSSRIKLRLCWK
jgi:hypothetical protein